MSLAAYPPRLCMSIVLDNVDIVNTNVGLWSCCSCQRFSACRSGLLHKMPHALLLKKLEITNWGGYLYLSTSGSGQHVTVPTKSISKTSHAVPILVVLAIDSMDSRLSIHLLLYILNYFYKFTVQPNFCVCIGRCKIISHPFPLCPSLAH